MLFKIEKFSFKEIYALENVVCETATILFWSQCAKQFLRLFDISNTFPWSNQSFAKYRANYDIDNFNAMTLQVCFPRNQHAGIKINTYMHRSLTRICRYFCFKQIYYLARYKWQSRYSQAKKMYVHDRNVPRR